MTNMKTGIKKIETEVKVYDKDGNLKSSEKHVQRS